MDIFIISKSEVVGRSSDNQICRLPKRFEKLYCVDMTLFSNDLVTRISFTEIMSILNTITK